MLIDSTELTLNREYTICSITRLTFTKTVPVKATKEITTDF